MAHAAGVDGLRLPPGLSTPRSRASRGLRLSPTRAAARLLRKPAVIVSELAALAVAGVLGATILKPMFGSAWFLTIVALVGSSLFLVWKDQWRRTWRLWKRPATGPRLSGAPYRYEVEVPLSRPLPEPRVRYRDSLRVGLWGSPVFHLGLFLLVVAGVVRLLLGVDAVVDLVEGETLPPSPSGYGAQWPGLLARSFSLRDPLTLAHLRVETYADGSLRQLSAEVELGALRGEKRTVAINQPLSEGTRSLYLTSTYGPAAWLATDLGGSVEGHALLLYAGASGRYRGELQLSSGVRAVVFTRQAVDPTVIEVRVLQGAALLAAGALVPGQTIRLPNGRSLELRAITKWARFTAQRDLSVPVVYAGFALALLGALLMYGVIRVQSEVAWSPTPTGVRLTVAMRPQRFAPLFASRFERLVAESRAELVALGAKGDA